MIYIVSIVSGVVITCIALFIINNMIKQALQTASLSEINEKSELRESLSKIEEYVGKMQHTFSDVSDDLEKRLVLLQEHVDRLDAMKNKDYSMTDMYPINHQAGIHNKLSMQTQRKLVLNLAQEGLSPSEIAKLLGMGKGEVNLLLNIKK